ncbi:MAG: AMP-binding protein [Oscillospiraceae bacterium]|nr:AMP-binding protein [Oscillospiraceae bacterium]
MEKQLLNTTLGDWMDKMAAEYPDNDALVYPDRGLRLSYKQFNEKARETAKGLIALGVSKGDHVAVWASNYPEWAYTYFACAKLGAVLVTVNTNYKIFELEYLLRQSDARLLLFSDGVKGLEYTPVLKELLPELETLPPSAFISERLPLLRRVVHMPKNGSVTGLAGTQSFSEMLAAGVNIPDAALDAIQTSIKPSDVLSILYTSGTTGFPKGVMLTHHNLVNNGYFIGENMKFTHKDRLCIPVPFFHCFGLVLGMMACVTHASTMVPIEAYSPLGVLEAVQAEKCTAVHGVPTMFIFILDHPDFAKYDVSTLRTGIMAGSTCPIEVMRRVFDQMNMSEIVIVFGQTECSPGMTMSQTDDPIEKRVSTVGRLLPHTEGKIIDPETGEPCPPNVQGEICTRGYLLMKGYYKMPEATAAAIDEEGWLHTGDVGLVDEEGYYVITGRIKDMIIRGGENVYPREIEELIYHHPAVRDVQVVGVPSKKFGEEICAYIIIKDGETASEQDIKDFVAARMSRHKIPSYIIFTDSFPMNAAGKILKYKMRDHAKEVLGL